MVVDKLKRMIKSDFRRSIFRTFFLEISYALLLFIVGFLAAVQCGKSDIIHAQSRATPEETLRGIENRSDRYIEAVNFALVDGRWDTDRTFINNRYVFQVSKAELKSGLFTQFVEVKTLDGKETIFRDYHQFAGNLPLFIRTPNRTYSFEPIYGIKDALIRTVFFITNDGTEPWLPENPGTVTSIYGETSDGRCYSQDAAWTIAQSFTGGGTCVDGTGSDNMLYYGDFGATYDLVQSFFEFDTSIIPATDTISSVAFSLVSNGTGAGSHGGTWQARIYDWGGTLTDPDWIDVTTSSNWTGLSLVATIADGSWTSTNETRNTFISEASFLTNINTSGSTFIVTGHEDLPSSAPADFVAHSGYFADTAGTDDDPLLIVTHEAQTNIMNFVPTNMDASWLMVWAVMTLATYLIGRQVRHGIWYILSLIFMVVFIFQANSVFPYLAGALYIPWMLWSAWKNEPKQPDDPFS